MRILVFVTDDGQSLEGTGPIVYLIDAPAAILPRHPRSMQWRYFATMDSDDVILEEERPQLLAALERGKPFLSSRLIAGKRLVSFEWRSRE